MFYVMSDIHGNYEKYMQVFDGIGLRDNDTLYVLGDVIDRGEYPIRILQDMMYRVNVVPLVGNHEYMALEVLKALLKIESENFPGFDEELLLIMQLWMAIGGKTTLDEFVGLSQADRESILEYLDEFRLYEEVTCNGKDYILVHAGFANFRENKALDEYELHELVWQPIDYETKYFGDKYIVTGHVPTMSIEDNNFDSKIYRVNNHIAIDCGCVFGGRLAVLCLNDGREFYF